MLKRKCVICGKEFFIKKFHAEKGWGKLCSINCRAEAQRNGIWLKCENCGKNIYRTPRDFKKSKSKRFFCSVSCHCSWENKNVRCGANAPNWIAGENAYRDLLRRNKVLEKCKRCGAKDERILTVHHKDGNRKNNKIENLEWLCWNCHCIEHYC
ncbi:MAG: HNH endonuclease [Actinobacteria bacterium]|nr:HNH endonuclease [Actinomycetota bacterium]